MIEQPAPAAAAAWWFPAIPEEEEEILPKRERKKGKERMRALNTSKHMQSTCYTTHVKQRKAI